MPEPRTCYKIFIASPSGLEDERKVFYEMVEKYNEIEAHPIRLTFEGRGWEKARSGYERPQDIMNGLLRDCDYYRLVLWDRWGSPPDPEGRGPCSSGSEEEFILARDLRKNEQGRMIDLCVFFKVIEPENDIRLNSEERHQREEVLLFKDQLRDTKEVNYKEFADVRDFERLLWQHLAIWRRDHEHGAESRVTDIARFS